eukprot:6457111-Amphidinium_carterae.1
MLSQHHAINSATMVAGLACTCLPSLLVDKRVQSLRTARDICLSLEERAAQHAVRVVGTRKKI